MTTPKPRFTTEQIEWLITQVLQPPGVDAIKDDDNCKCIDSYGCGIHEALTHVVKVLMGCAPTPETSKFPEPGCFNEFNPTGMPYL